MLGEGREEAYQPSYSELFWQMSGELREKHPLKRLVQSLYEVKPPCLAGYRALVSNMPGCTQEHYVLVSSY